MTNLEDVAAERALLAGICQYGKDAYLDCRDIVNENCFNHTNTLIYAALRNALDKNLDLLVDLPTILSSAKELGLSEELNGHLKYITSLFNFRVELSNIRGFAKKLRIFDEVKGLIGRFDDTVTSLNKISGNEPISEIVSIAETEIFKFTSKIMCGNQQVEQFGVGLDEYYQYLMDNRGNLAGVGIGFPKYEQAIGGLRGGVHVISARRKHGKSFFALNAALFTTYRQKVPVLFLDTELQKEQGQWDRFIARLSDGVNVDDIKLGNFFDNDMNVSKVQRAIKLLKKLPLDYVNVTGRKIDEVLSIIRRWLIQKIGYNEQGKLNKCLVVYDYLKPPTDSQTIENMKEYQSIGLVVGYLHDITTEFGFPILTFAQKNQDHAVALSDRISWYASSISSFSKKDETEMVEDGRQYGNRKLVVDDCRFGEGMDYGDYINCAFNGKLSIITETKTRNEILREKKQQTTV